MGRHFLFTLVNTKEPTYFRRALSEHIALTKASVTKKTGLVHIDQGMLDLLNAHIENVWQKKPPKACGRTLNEFKLGVRSKKRPYKQVTPTLTTQLVSFAPTNAETVDVFARLASEKKRKVMDESSV